MAAAAASAASAAVTALQATVQQQQSLLQQQQQQMQQDALQFQQLQQQVQQLLQQQGNAAAAAAPANAAVLTRSVAITAPKEFKGTTRGTDAHRWLQSMELYFEEAGIVSDVDRLRAAGRLLTNGAASWWELERSKSAGAVDKITTWNLFVTALKKTYEPVDIAMWVRQQMSDLAAKGMTNVQAYTEQFSDLSSQIESSKMLEEDRIYHYRHGLPSDIRSNLTSKTKLTTLQLNMDAAIRVSANRTTSSHSATAPTKNHFFKSKSATVNQIENQSEVPFDIVSAFQAMQVQLNAIRSDNGRSRPKPARIPGLSNELANARINKRLCIKCGQSGHFGRECTNPVDTTTVPK